MDKRSSRNETIAWMTTALADGMDRVFQIPTAFSAGFMKDLHKERRSPVRRAKKWGGLETAPPWLREGCSAPHRALSDIPAPVAATPLPILKTGFRSPTS